jgi:hypothetical protein
MTVAFPVAEWLPGRLGAQMNSRPFRRFLALGNFTGVRLGVGIVSLHLITCAWSLQAAAATPNVTAKLSQSGIRFIAERAIALMPKKISLPSFEKQLADCPLSDEDLKLSFHGGQAKVEVVSVSSAGLWGHLHLGATLNISGNGSATLTKSDGCFGPSAWCTITFSAKGIDAALTAKPTLTSGQLTLDQTLVGITIPADQLNVSIEGCGLVGSAAAVALDHAKALIADVAEDKLHHALTTSALPLLQQQIPDVISFSGSHGAIDFSATLEALQVSSKGIEVGIDLALQTTAPPTCQAGLEVAPQPSAPSTAPSPDWGENDEHLVLGLSAELLNTGLTALWRGGALCLKGPQLQAAGLPTTLPSGLAKTIGFTGGTSVSLKALGAPSAELIPGDGVRIQLTLPGVRLEASGDSANGPGTVSAEMTALVEGALRVDGPSQAVVLDAVSINIVDFTLEATGSTGLKLGDPWVATLVAGLVASMARKRIKDLALVPSIPTSTIIGESQGHGIALVRSHTTSSAIELALNFFFQPKNDTKGPRTILVDGPAAWTRQQYLMLRVTGADDHTPTAMLRYAYRVDGGPWSKKTSNPNIDLVLDEGAHQIQIRAFDLNDNGDPSALSVAVLVDSEAPAWLVGDEKDDTADLTDPATSNRLGGCTLASAPIGEAFWLLLILGLQRQRRTAARMISSSLGSTKLAAGPSGT